jgi:HTH-type transcriptional regulator, competence development regulator
VTPDLRPRGESFGQMVRRRRRELHLTQREVALALGIDFTYLSKIENDKGDPPAESIVRKLAGILEIDEEELLALAAKVPPGLRVRAGQDVRFARLLRQLPEVADKDLQDLYKRLGIASDAP